MTTARITTHSLRRWLWLPLSLIGSVIFGFLLSVHVIAQGITGAASFSKALAAPTFANTFGINVLVVLAIVLFVKQTGWGSLRVVLTVAAALFIGFGLMLLISKDPFQAYNALLTGPLSRLNRWGGWIDDAMGLALVSLAITIVFRAQLFSLGAEGQIVLGALAAGVVGLFVTGLPPAIHIPLALGVGALVGFLWGLIPGVLRAYLDANELVSTLMLNPVAVLLYNLLLEPLKPPKASFVTSADIPISALLPRIIPGTRITTAIFMVVGAVIVVWLLMQYTPLGYAIRMIGANPRFARYGGINTRRTILLTMAISGIFAGLTGGYLALAIDQKLILSISGGLTFEGIVVALLARNNPLAVPAMALLYSYLRVGGPIMQTDASVSLEIVRVIQAIIILLFTAEGLVTFLRLQRTRTRSTEGLNDHEMTPTDENAAIRLE